MRKKVFENGGIFRRTAAVFLAAILTIGLAACGSSSADSGEESTDETAETAETADADSGSEEYTLRVGVIKALGTAAPYVAELKGYYEEAGLDVELTEFADGSAMMEAFASEELDVAVGGIAPTANWYSQGVGIKVVAGCNGGGHVIVTREETGITSVEDLAGHIIAEPNLGTVTDTLLRDYILAGAGLDPEEDVQILSGLKPADMATSLFDTKEVDAIITWEPYVTQAEETYDDLVIVYDSAAEIKEDTGSDSFYPVNVVSASDTLIEEHSDILEAFLDVYKETVDYINAGDEANAELAEIMELDEEIVAGARTRIDYNYEIDEEGLTETLTWTLDLGYIDELPDASDFYYYFD